MLIGNQIKRDCEHSGNPAAGGEQVYFVNTNLEDEKTIVI